MGEAEIVKSQNIKFLCLHFQFFVQLPNLVLVCGVVDHELLKNIVPVKCRFCGSIAMGSGHNNSSQ